METITPNKSYIRTCQLLFAACVGVTYLNNYELTFAVWAVTLLLSVRRKYSLPIIYYSACFAAIFGIALVVSLFKEFSNYNFFRDISYMLKPILGMVVGYQLARHEDVKPFHTMMYTGLGIALIHLGIIVYSAALYRIINIHELRHYTGYFGDFEFYALLIVVFHKEFGIELSGKKKWLLLLIIGTSAILYLSRTNFIQYIVMYLAMKGYFKLTRRAIVVMSSVIAITLVGYTIIYNMSLSRNGKGMEAFLYKIKNAPIEAFKSKVNQNDWEDFNDNYRSFETIITIKQVGSEGTSGVLFGKGMGATIDVGRRMMTNDGEYIRFVPTLHNGYTTIYLKAGIIGICFNVLFMILLMRQGKSDIPIVQNINLFLKGTAIFLFVANWVLLGLYLKIDNKSLIIGFALAYKELIVKRKLLEPNESS